LVNVRSGALTLRQVGGHTIHLKVKVRVVNGHTVVVLTFRTDNLNPQALADGNYALRIDGNRLFDATGQPLPLRKEVRFWRLFGGVFGDGSLSARDLTVFSEVMAGDPAMQQFRRLFVPATMDDLWHLDAALGLPFSG